MTNNLIKAKAPADYLVDTAVFPKGPTPELIEPHFLPSDAIGVMRQGRQATTKSEIGGIYEAFLAARERALIAEIRRACGVPEPGTAMPVSPVDLSTQTSKAPVPSSGLAVPLQASAVETPRDMLQPDDADQDLAPRHFMRREFWQAFMQRAAGKGSLPAQLGKGISSWIYARAPKKRLYWNYYIRMHDAGLDLLIYRHDAEENKRLFDQLFSRRKEIEDAIGALLDWNRNDGGHGSVIRYRITGGGLRARDKWPEIQERMIETIRRFQKALASAIEELPD